MAMIKKALLHQAHDTFNLQAKSRMPYWYAMHTMSPAADYGMRQEQQKQFT